MILQHVISDSIQGRTKANESLEMERGSSVLTKISSYDNNYRKEHHVQADLIGTRCLSQ